MPTFDVVSEVDRQELRNAVDQAQREVTTRFDFKDTGSTIELSDTEIRLHSSTEDRLRAPGPLAPSRRPGPTRPPATARRRRHRTRPVGRRCHRPVPPPAAPRLRSG